MSGVVAQRVEMPTTVSQLQKIMKKASREKLSVLPLGRGISLGAAFFREKVDIALYMTGLSDIISFDRKNLYMTVKAGMTVDSINRYLEDEAEGFFMPLDPPMSHRATIGGIYASNITGPSRLLYGTLRDQVLGGNAVDAGGCAFKFGGVTVKNVAGYDLTKFFIGSAGTLCILTDISFRIHPLPEVSSICEVDIEHEKEVQGLLSDLLASVLIPTGIVVTTPETSDTCFRFFVAFEGHAGAVERQNRDFMKLAKTMEVKAKVVLEESL
eukprot:CAMPEP_0201286096 /NCGR_PEP_ID=MMETSP1317-20130820/114253_1 /ASSEMBLY_ACC=CAM_ASM_000770 /TAXON_ID=187299 /ORGANISM="Undescribed Undescribed, Strain Undescribed" /LENGTH=268 /DNA_ID=CAMNT_0047612599 /DNA_START=609 /DNA_END=1416 /DNA_ORIENTATION=-